MIQANEIRLGNYITEKGRGNLIVTEITANGVLTKHQATSYTFSIPYDNLEGIALTSEILEQCGFLDRIEDEDIDVENRNDISYMMKCDEVCIGINPESSWELVHVGANYSEEPEIYSLYRAKIKYLHQLQNLYFALIGQELSINLTKNPT